MEKRILGRSGLEVSVIGFGTIAIGGFYGPVDDAKASVRFTRQSTPE